MSSPDRAYTPIPEWNWTFQVSVHRGQGLTSVPTAPGAFRLVWVVEGSAQWEVEGQLQTIVGPSLVFLSGRDRVVARQDHTEVRSVVFHPGALNDAFVTGDVYDLAAFQGTTKSDQYYLHPFLRHRGDPLAAVRLTLPLVERLHSLFEKMEEELRARSDGFWPCRTRSVLLEALILARQVPAPTTEPGLVDLVLMHLHTHYVDPIRLPELAQRFATNRTTLAARFREQTGQSVADYIRNHRVKVAEVLLRDTTIPVQEIMTRVGFSDPSQFGRLFRRLTGHNPTEYRRQFSWLLRSAS